jgi:hypothetical protein
MSESFKFKFVVGQIVQRVGYDEGAKLMILSREYEEWCYGKRISYVCRELTLFGTNDAVRFEEMELKTSNA